MAISLGVVVLIAERLRYQEVIENAIIFELIVFLEWLLMRYEQIKMLLNMINLCI